MTGCQTVEVTNGTLTDDGDGFFSLSTGGGGGAPTDADYLVGTSNGSLSAEIVVGTSPGGELGNTWASPTLDDSVAVSSWNLTTPTITTSLTTSTPTTLSVAELDRLDGLTGIIVTDTTATTEIDGTNLTIAAGTLNVDAASSFATSVTSPLFASNNADPADAGLIRLGNAENLAWEAAPAGTDYTLGVDSGEILQASGAITSGGTITGVAGTFSGLVSANANLTIGNGATTAGVLTLLEDTDAGSNFASFQVPALAANTVYTLPANDGDASQFLQTDGNGVLTWATSSGSGDITDVFNCASGDCASIAAADGDLLSFASVSVSSTTEGLILPQHATDCSTAGTAEGQVCWEADANTLYVGDGSTVVAVGSGSDTNAVKEYWFPCPAMLPLEAAESIPPLAKDAGTNLDQLACGFDADADEGRTVVFKVPSDVQAGSTITFRAYSYSAAATTGDFILDFRHNSGVADGVDPDASLTTEASSADTTAGTAGQLNITIWTETLANLGWAANDLVYGVLYRDANNASDTLAGDLLIIGLSVEIPRA